MSGTLFFAIDGLLDAVHSLEDGTQWRRAAHNVIASAAVEQGWEWEHTGHVIVSVTVYMDDTDRRPHGPAGRGALAIARDVEDLLVSGRAGYKKRGAIDDVRDIVYTEVCAEPCGEGCEPGVSVAISETVQQ